MEPFEIQAKASIAAALIVTRAVEVPAIPTYGGADTSDTASVRLRELTNYVYRVITCSTDR
jgi:hypothetical protein